MVLKVIAGCAAALEINAPPNKVWKAAVDFPHDRTWNTQLSFLGGEVKPGGTLHLRLGSTHEAAPHDGGRAPGICPDE